MKKKIPFSTASELLFLDVTEHFIFSLFSLAAFSSLVGRLTVLPGFSTADTFVSDSEDT